MPRPAASARPRRRTRAAERTPLNRDRVLRAAMELADAEGLDALTMRTLGQRVGVEAMSLYKHVANKDDLLDGLIELVFAEMLVTPAGTPWRDAVRLRAASARAVMLRHRWAAMLVEGRTTPGPNRLRHHEAFLRALRAGGFPVALAYAAFMTLDAYIYGYVLQEVAWPFEPEERPQLVEQMRHVFSEKEHPSMLEVMGYAFQRDTTGRPGAWADEDFAFGLELILDGLERARDAGRVPGR